MNFPTLAYRKWEKNLLAYIEGHFPVGVGGGASENNLNCMISKPHGRDGDGAESIKWSFISFLCPHGQQGVEKKLLFTEEAAKEPPSACNSFISI